MWNEIASPTTCNLTKNGQFYLNLCFYFLLMLRLVFELSKKWAIFIIYLVFEISILLYKKNSVKKYIYSKFQRAVISCLVIISCSTCCLVGPVKVTWVCASFDSNLVIISWLVVWISFLSCFEIFKWTFSKMYFGQHKVKFMTIQTLKVAWNESLYFMLTKNIWTAFENRTGRLKIAHFHKKSLYFLYENDTLQHCLSFDLRKMAIFSAFEVRVFQQVCFLGGLLFLRYRVRVWGWFLDGALFHSGE